VITFIFVRYFLKFMISDLQDLCKSANKYERELVIARSLASSKISGFEQEVYAFLGNDVFKFSNIIANVKGKNAKKKIAFSAHYDKLGKGEGAVDNAAGVAELLDVARVIKKSPEGLDVSFLFFDGEENGLIGSGRYVYDFQRDNPPFDALYNVDICGRGNAVVVGDYSLHFWDVKYKKNSFRQNNVVGKVCAKRNIPFYRIKHMPGGDNTSFTIKGFPATMINTFSEEEVHEILNGTDPYELPSIKQIHNEKDVFSRVEESTMKMTRDVLLDIIEFYRT
jgi:Zn-dependent M28 family amino/carboxypeptidase